MKFSGPLPPSDITNNGVAYPGAQHFTNLQQRHQRPRRRFSGHHLVLNLSGDNLFTGNLTNTSGFLVLSKVPPPAPARWLTAAAGGGGQWHHHFQQLLHTIVHFGPEHDGHQHRHWCVGGQCHSWAAARNGVRAATAARSCFSATRRLAQIFSVVPRGGIQFASNAVAVSTASGYFGRDSSGAKRSLNLTIRDNATVGMAGCSMGGGKTGGSITITVQNNASLSFGTNVDLHNVANSSAVSSLRLNGGTTMSGGFTKPNRLIPISLLSMVEF